MDRDQAARDAAGQDAAGAAADRAVVLVVDDQPANLRVLSDLLQPRYRVRVANSGSRALKIAGQQPYPDLILLDVMMPEMDGHSVLKRLQQNGATRDIPVIFVTAMNSPLDEENGLALGAVDYIAKPVLPPLVLARVHAHVELKRARDRLKSHNTELEAEVARRLAENHQIQDVTIRALGGLAEIRDPETGNHIRRTQEYVRLLARLLRHHPRFAASLTERSIELLAKSAPLHDIGKVGIPDHVLLKPGKLTDAEWEVMKTHTRLGADAIERAEPHADKPVEFLTIAKQITRWHHERWDGSGYPDGLQREEIPVSARVMALADVFDALISPRVYKSALPLEHARDAIAAGRGTHFDPDLVDAFLAHFDEFRAIAEQYHDGLGA
jgi:putative two-component system response regulator